MATQATQGYYAVTKEVQGINGPTQENFGYFLHQEPARRVVSFLANVGLGNAKVEACASCEEHVTVFPHAVATKELYVDLLQRATVAKNSKTLISPTSLRIPVPVQASYQVLEVTVNKMRQTVGHYASEETALKVTALLLEVFGVQASSRSGQGSIISFGPHQQWVYGPQGELLPYARSLDLAEYQRLLNLEL